MFTRLGIFSGTLEPIVRLFGLEGLPSPGVLPAYNPPRLAVASSILAQDKIVLLVLLVLPVLLVLLALLALVVLLVLLVLVVLGTASTLSTTSTILILYVLYCYY